MGNTGLVDTWDEISNRPIEGGVEGHTSYELKQQLTDYKSKIQKKCNFKNKITLKLF